MNHLKGEDEIKRRMAKESKDKKEREEEIQKKKLEKEPIVEEIVTEFIRKIQMLRPELILKVGPEEDEVSWWGGRRKHKYTSEYDAIRIYTSYGDAEHRSYYLTLDGQLYDGLKLFPGIMTI